MATTAIRVATERVRRQGLTHVQRTFIGALGGVAPVLVNVLSIDPDAVFSEAQTLAIAGWLVRIAVLCGLGALVAWLHQKETNPWKVFQLGIAGPALITAVLNGQAAKHSGRFQPADIGAIVLPAKAYAQQPDRADSVYSFAAPPESRLQQFWRGLTGIRNDARWFVLFAREFQSIPEARGAAQVLRSRFGLESRVYTDGGPNPEMAYVAVADWTDAAEAESILTRLRSTGQPFHLWQQPYGRH